MLLPLLLNLGLGGTQTTSASIRVKVRPDTSIAVSVYPLTTITTRHQPETVITSEIDMSILHVGDTATIDGEFRVLGVTLTDPTSVSFVVQRTKDASGLAVADASATYTYGTHSEVTKTSTGKYRAKINCTASGRWDYYWSSPGPTAKGTEPGWFDVEPLPI